MKEIDSPDDHPPFSNRLLTWARNKNPFGANDSPQLPSHRSRSPHHEKGDLSSATAQDDRINRAAAVTTKHDHENGETSASSHANDSQTVAAEGGGKKAPSLKAEPRLSIRYRMYRDTKQVITASWINWLLVFVPIGIAFGIMYKIKGANTPISPNIVFAVNAIAIIPLAYLLCYATESVAAKVGDTLGALLNVTFGNAVELIIFIIALQAKEIRIVQASLLGSILANLLLILGMSFLFGGLRFREQLYNTAVSQMSACLLSLSVVSLLLLTAFHASFSNATAADAAVVKVSRGTSVVLLVVYVLYLLFQLKSHAYMYESTPQYLIDEESHPGVLADILNSSSSSDSSSSDGSDSESSSSSRHTSSRIKRALRRKRRKSNASSKEVPSVSSVTRTPSSHTNNNSIIEEFPTSESPKELSPRPLHRETRLVNGEEADTDGERDYFQQGSSGHPVTRDFELEKKGVDRPADKAKGQSKSKPSKRSKRSKRRGRASRAPAEDGSSVIPNAPARATPQVGFAPEVQEIADSNMPKRPFHPRHLSSHVGPAISKALSSSVFSHPHPHAQTLPGPGIRPPAARHSGNAIRRTASLPELLSRTVSGPQARPPLAQTLPANQSSAAVDPQDIADGQAHLSTTSAIIWLLLSTGLVAACAEFLVSSIDYLVSNSGISQAFIGLIILPIVGNAAEHVTAVTMASKNKMDLAIGVALGSSIQIALFVTPVIVLLGWILKTDMSLYFSLFETVSLFASAFIVNYLMIDGRSNYLEGALLMAAYVIIAVSAFFYPSCGLSVASGPVDSTASC